MRLGGECRWRDDKRPRRGTLHEDDDDDHAREKNRNERVGVAGNIKVEHWLPSFHTGLDGSPMAKV